MPERPTAVGPDEYPDGVIVCDAATRVILANAAATRILGHPQSALVGRALGEALDPRAATGDPLLGDGSWPPSAHLRSVSGFPETEVVVRGSVGQEIKVMVTGRYRRDGEGTLVGAVLALRDGARRSAAAAHGIEVVSTVSHELRAPLTSVKGYTSLLLNRWDRLADEQKRMMLEQVNHDADRVTRLVAELLDISRLETGRLVLRRQLVDVPSVVANVVEKVRMMEAALEVTVEFPDKFPAVYADPDKIEQVLTNLVENAVKYADPTGMKVFGSSDSESISVTVADRGQGIPASDLPRVFTKFFRRAETRPTGSGLGLWISRGLVEAHGGRLVVESVVGEGSTFRFTLPTAIPEELSLS